uniref:AlNc14C17G1808 protein n=1 Tax=Albugo laibachii Nc14 TaxID=890382 RepID=F0W4I7_9STRA|nr:AlNc14C17G1808 [Albugo laibachii Nc14]|eukprot:CCA16020.1 AlNc14C17G1808 [Albugo laibachii Nc14]
MQWAQEAWEIVMCTTVANCWHHTKMIDDDVYELVESITQLALGQQPHHTADEFTHSYSALLTFYNQYLYLSKYLLYFIYFYTIFRDGILKGSVKAIEMNRKSLLHRLSYSKTRTILSKIELSFADWCTLFENTTESVAENDETYCPTESDTAESSVSDWRSVASLDSEETASLFKDAAQDLESLVSTEYFQHSQFRDYRRKFFSAIYWYPLYTFTLYLAWLALLDAVDQHRRNGRSGEITANHNEQARNV